MELPDELDVTTWLVEHRADLDRGEAEWLDRLAEFDRDGLWALDRHFCCATWLVWRTNMARSTAFEKLRIAHELSRRPIIADEFRRGRLSYSAVRAITRMEGPDPEVDQAMVELAQSGHATILDLERVVRSYALYADQAHPPTEDLKTRRDVRIRRGENGMGQIVITLSDVEIEEFAAALQAFIDLRYRPEPVDESSAEDGPANQRAVDESSGGDPGEAPLEEANRSTKRADAMMDLINCGLAAADRGHVAGDDRYMIHLVRRDGHPSCTFMDGTPVHPSDAEMIKCDCSTVSHVVDGDGEQLNLGRRTRAWSVSQRRAISVRDGGHCRFPGCRFRHFDIHHISFWEAGGCTDISNGVCKCRRHHRIIHAGYQLEGDPNGELRFHRPDGTFIGSTYPAAARVLSYQP